jgi:hypothetical protein
MSIAPIPFLFFEVGSASIETEPLSTPKEASRPTWSHGFGYVGVVIGIAPPLLLAQVRSTAGWALDGDGAAPATSFRAALADVEAAEAAHAASPQGVAYFRLLLAAHFSTVATFVPTDVDARIRHHAFAELDEAALGAACDVVDEAAGWSVPLVSARVVAGVSGHDGEWLSVRAGALGRAAALGATGLAARLREAIDAELAREHAVFADLVARGDPLDVLRAATTLAHNLGDLSRVVEAWPALDRLAPLRAEYTRLGHAPSPRFGDLFARAGALNKAEMAGENHRFLALRKARGLRASRALLLPIGPLFDDWGAAVATHAALDERDRAEVVAALLGMHVARPTERGCLRALAAIDARTTGGLAAYASMLPARLRKTLSAGPVRDALKTPRAVFEARLRKRAGTL